MTYNDGPVWLALGLTWLVGGLCAPSWALAYFGDRGVRLSTGVETNPPEVGMCGRDLHPMSGVNLYVAPNGRRACRVCKRDADRKRKLPRVPRTGVSAVGARFTLEFQQAVARNGLDAQAKTCREMNLTAEQYAAAMADWAQDLTSST